MDFKKYESKKQFLDENLEILIKEEAQNEVMIGIVLQHDDSKVEKWLLGRIEENGEVKIIFIVDDDKEGLVFYCPNKNITTEHIEFLVYSIINSDTALEQIVGNKEFSKRIGEIYCMKTGKNIIKT